MADGLNCNSFNLGAFGDATASITILWNLRNDAC